MSFHNNAIFWIEVGKIKPNPFQPRRDFDESKLRDLADSIRQYGVLQPLVVTRSEREKPDGGLAVEYELIAGERRLRASKLANVSTVPVIIRSSEENEQVKLELAIIENLQREDLNVVDRAQAFKQLNDKFSLSHELIGKKVGKSRVYVTNTLRILKLPEHMQQALKDGKMAESHTRPLLMLDSRPEEQETMFKEIYYNGMTVRDAELASRAIAKERSKKKELKLAPEIVELEGRVSESLGTRVRVEPKTVDGKVQGGKITINFFNDDEVKKILGALSVLQSGQTLEEKLDAFVENQQADTKTEDSSLTATDFADEEVPIKADTIHTDTGDIKKQNEMVDGKDAQQEEQVEEKILVPEEGRPIPEDEDNTVTEDVSEEMTKESEDRFEKVKDENEKSASDTEDGLYSLSNFSL